MISLRDVVIFFAGAEFFHTLSHIILTYLINFPLRTKVMIVSSSINNWAITVNALITIGLILWAVALTKKKRRAVAHHKGHAHHNKR